MASIRKLLAFLALAALGSLAATIDSPTFLADPRQALLARLLVLPLGVTMFGVVLETVWGRWLALGTGVAVLPWAFVLTFGMPERTSVAQPIVALTSSILVITSLSGRSMFDRYEGKAGMDWSGPRMALVRWTIILNTASVLGLLAFVAFYRAAVEWHTVIPAALLVTLLMGVVLLGFQRAAGLVFVAAGCVLFVPAGTYFALLEASYAGEVYLFAACFLPGVIAGWACLFAFARPVWKALR